MDYLFSVSEVNARGHCSRQDTADRMCGLHILGLPPVAYGTSLAVLCPRLPGLRACMQDL